MLHRIKDLLKYDISTVDGDLGTVSDFLFDDLEWRVRYLVVDTGDWLPGRRVLVSPVSIRKADLSDRRLHVELTRDQVKDSPGIETDRPVSRQHEIDLASHFSWPCYWEAYVGGGGPGAIKLAEEVTSSDEPEQTDSSLRSAKEVTGYHIEAKDGGIGHVEDLVADADDWTIRYVMVDTRNWLPGKKVLIAPWMVRSVHWDGKIVQVDMTCEQVKGAPEYDPTRTIDRDYEASWYDYYGRPRYWL